MKIKPLGDRVLVERLEAEKVTAGGIVLPDSAKEKPQQGKVISVGEGKTLEDGTVKPLQIKKGDKILTIHCQNKIKLKFAKEALDKLDGTIIR